MAARPTHDLAIKTGEYTDRNGQTKGRWQRVGTVFRHDDGGTSIKLDCIPVGLPDWDGWVSVFKREERDAAQQSPAAGRAAAQGRGNNGGDHFGPPGGNGHGQPSADFDDDIPF